jgi:hypothetical protein
VENVMTVEFVVYNNRGESCDMYSTSVLVVESCCPIESVGCSEMEVW